MRKLILLLGLLILAVLVASCAPAEPAEDLGDSGEETATEERKAIGGLAVALGGTCTQNSDCNQYLACVNGRCAECSTDSQCAVIGESIKTCRKRVPNRYANGTSIAIHLRNFANSPAPRYRCASLLENGFPCERAGQCLRDLCTNGRCAAREDAASCTTRYQSRSACESATGGTCVKDQTLFFYHQDKDGDGLVACGDMPDCRSFIYVGQAAATACQQSPSTASNGATRGATCDPEATSGQYRCTTGQCHPESHRCA